MSYEAGLCVEEKVASMFQPDTLIHAEYYEIFRRETHLEPEKKLMLAVLDDAIACFQNYMFARDGKGESLFHEAEDWILDENSDWLFSFEHICEGLGLDPRYVRQRLLGWKKKKLLERSKAQGKSGRSLLSGRRQIS
ncbi:MAG: hypothetical protein ACE5JU_05720 [Candidatus Binatia bacterium]